MIEDYVLPIHDPAYWSGHINGLILSDYKHFINGYVLDIGCNNGGTTKLLIGYPSVTSVTGLDINPLAIEAAIKNNSHEYIEYIAGDFLSYSFCQKFNTVICFHTLEHIDEKNVPLFFDKIYNSLEIGGKLILSIPYMKAYDNSYHKTYWNINKLKSQLDQNKFRILECFRDRRIDYYENKHDCITMVAVRI